VVEDNPALMLANNLALLDNSVGQWRSDGEDATLYFERPAILVGNFYGHCGPIHRASFNLDGHKVSTCGTFDRRGGGVALAGGEFQYGAWADSTCGTSNPGGIGDTLCSMTLYKLSSDLGTCSCGCTCP
jgi:hypothetical protein